MGGRRENSDGSGGERADEKQMLINMQRTIGQRQLLIGLGGVSGTEEEKGAHYTTLTNSTSIA